MVERRRPRLGLKVVHRHRVGDRQPFARVSDLVFVNGKPRVVLDWIDIGGVRTPLYQIDLDESCLRRRTGRSRNTYYYDGTTVDPRYADETDEKNERGMRFELMPRSG